MQEIDKVLAAEHTEDAKVVEFEASFWEEWKAMEALSLNRREDLEQGGIEAVV